MKRLDESDIKNDTQATFADIVDEGVYHKRPHLRMPYNSKASKCGCHGSRCHHQHRRVLLQGMSYNILWGVVDQDLKLIGDLRNELDPANADDLDEKAERLCRLLKLLSIRSTADITTRAGVFPADHVKDYAVTKKITKPGRATRPLSVDEQREVGEREDHVREWVREVFHADVGDVSYHKRRQGFTGSHYVVALLDRFCFNKGDNHTSNSSFVLVSGLSHTCR